MKAQVDGKFQDHAIILELGELVKRFVVEDIHTGRSAGSLLQSSLGLHSHSPEVPIRLI